MQTLKAALLVILGAILLTLSGQSNWALAQQSSPLLFVENVGQFASDESSQFQARLDIFDLTFIASRYNSTLSSADINGDGLVDILDLTLVAGNYGLRHPAFSEK